MKQPTILLCLLMFAIFSFTTADYNSTPETSVKDGWVELINGKDFTGWKATENKGTWSVKDGLFQADGKRSHLFYEGAYLQDGFKNFELEVQVKTFKLANTGIYFHTAYQEVGWPNKGMEIQVNNTHIGEGDYIELKKTASLYGVRNLYKAFGRDGEWMTIKARVQNNRVQVWLNGMQTVDYLQPEKTPQSIKRLGKGTFCLQGHDSLSKMQYKSFKVRRLPDDAHSKLIAPAFGAWYDSMMVLQGRQFAFIDLNPKQNLSATELANFVYNTGINASLVKTAKEAKKLKLAKNLPLFKGIKVFTPNEAIVQHSVADYIIGESSNAKSAQALLSTNKINIWADKGHTLNTNMAEELLNLAKQNNIAIEIDNVTQSPSVQIIKMAKAKGCKFTFAGLLPAAHMQQSTYIFTAIKEANLNYKDIYIPKW